MDDPGNKLKRMRELLCLRYRDVEEFSQQIASKRKSGEYTITISRLSDIENRGVVPTIYKLYSLCAIYRLEVNEVLRWYGVDMGRLAGDAAAFEVQRTHLVGFGRESLGPYQPGEVQVPLSLDPGVDLRKTTFLSRFIQNWGVLPLMLVSALDLKNHRYAFVGTDDWFMYPILQPGSLLLIDQSKRKITASGWASEFDRPIYFLEHRDGWLCAWCDISGDNLVAIPHPISGRSPIVMRYPSGVEVIGQVTGVANRLDPGLRRNTRA
jgi:hypothetical protein